GSLVQPAVVRSAGKGRTVYLGFDAFGAFAAARVKVEDPAMVKQASQFMDSMAATIQAAGVTLPIDVRISSTLQDAEPTRAPMWSVQFKEAGDQKYLVLLTDYSRATK